MLGNILLSVGGLFFAILIGVVYFIKSKQTGIDNNFFKLNLIFLNLTIISELVAIGFMNSYGANSIQAIIGCRINALLTISWIISFCCYLLTIGKGYKISNIREYVKNDYRIKVLLVIYYASMIVSFFFRYNNVNYDDVIYMSGPAQYYLYAIGLIAVVVSIIVVIRTNKEQINMRMTPIVVGTISSLIWMILQLIYPEYLILTAMFVFDTYIIYFMFENPDLYLIKELEIARQNADDSNRSKTQFLSNMSHEIRTPMNAILGFSNGILTETKFDSKSTKKDVSHIYSAGNNLLEIINNVLDISKIESGEEKIENKEYDLESIVLELKSIIDARIIDEKIRFITEIDPKTPNRLVGDKTKIFQILLNILSNSVKYTEVGRIVLSIKSEINDNKATLHFKISDTGYGIKKEDYEKLFEKFSRLEIASQKEIEGTGLGLAITKKLVTLLGGKIWFESEYGAGTVFYIDLIQKISDLNAIGKIKAEEQKNIDYIDCSKYKVLLVDDNDLNLKVAKKVLSNYKFQINLINNGEDCINHIKEGNIYDIIFLDHMMPKMDGIEVLHILKKLKDYNIPPIVVLTANAITGMKEMYLNEGFDDYLSKPINITELDKIVRKYFNKKGDNKNE